jgi:hypothetical protein
MAWSVDCDSAMTGSMGCGRPIVRTLLLCDMSSQPQPLLPTVQATLVQASLHPPPGKPSANIKGFIK